MEGLGTSPRFLIRQKVVFDVTFKVFISSSPKKILKE